MAIYSGVERRKRKRYGIKGSTICYKKGLFSSASDLYLMLNTSETGLMFISQEELPLGKKMTCTLGFEELEGTIQIAGKVIWTRKSQTHQAYRTGIQLLKISETDLQKLRIILSNTIGDTLQIETGVFLKEIRKL
jgi:Tfp pilus assembly protein PilZ